MDSDQRPSHPFQGSRNKRPVKESKSLLYGIRPILEALESGKELESLYIQKGAGGSLIRELRDQLDQRMIPYQLVPIEKLNRLTVKVHQGAVAFLSQLTYHRLDSLIQTLFEDGKIPLIMMLDRITDVRNFGAIARSCACLDAHAIVIPARGAAQINEDAMKTSAGALHTFPVCRENNLKDALSFLRNSGLTIVCCTEKASDTLDQVDLTHPVCLVLGSEEDGISEGLLKASDQLVHIPMHGVIESLNVSVTAGIILAETQRQRRTISNR